METLRFGFIDLFNRDGAPQLTALVNKLEQGLRKRQHHKKIEVVDAQEGKHPTIIIRNTKIPDLRGDNEIVLFDLGTNMDPGLIYSLHSIYAMGYNEWSAYRMKCLFDSLARGCIRDETEERSAVMSVLSGNIADKFEKRMVFVSPEDCLEWVVEKDILQRIMMRDRERQNFIKRMHSVGMMMELRERQIIEADIYCGTQS